MSEERIYVSGDEPQLGGEGSHFSGLEPESFSLVEHTLSKPIIISRARVDL